MNIFRRRSSVRQDDKKIQNSWTDFCLQHCTSNIDLDTLSSFLENDPKSICEDIAKVHYLFEVLFDTSYRLLEMNQELDLRVGGLITKCLSLTEYVCIWIKNKENIGHLLQEGQVKIFLQMLLKLTDTQDFIHAVRIFHFVLFPADSDDYRSIGSHLISLLSISNNDLSIEILNCLSYSNIAPRLPSSADTHLWNGQSFLHCALSQEKTVNLEDVDIPICSSDSLEVTGGEEGHYVVDRMDPLTSCHIVDAEMGVCQSVPANACNAGRPSVVAITASSSQSLSSGPNDANPSAEKRNGERSVSSSSSISQLSMAARGFNLALSAVSEFLKYTPWVGGLSREQLESKGNSSDDANSDLAFLSHLPLVVPRRVLEEEEQRYSQMLLIQQKLNDKLVLSLNNQIQQAELDTTDPTDVATLNHSFDSLDMDKENITDKPTVLEGLLGHLIVGLSTASSGTLVLHLLKTVSILFHDNPKMQTDFDCRGGYATLVAALLRIVEKSVELSDSVAPDVPANEPPTSLVELFKMAPANTRPAAKTTTNFFVECFEILLDMLLGGSSNTEENNVKISTPVNPARRTNCISNSFLLHQLVLLLQCGHPNLVMLSLRVISVALRLNSVNIIWFKRANGLVALCSLMGYISAYGSLPVKSINSSNNFDHGTSVNNDIDVSADLPADTNIPSYGIRNTGPLTDIAQGNSEYPNRPPQVTAIDPIAPGGSNSAQTTSISIGKVMILAKDIMSLLQYIAIITSEESPFSPILAYLVALSHVSCKIQRKGVSGKGSTSSSATSHFGSLCMNCETESAVIQCVHSNCIGDNCHFFCAACDNVFHKAVAKRGHIRIPVIASDPLRSVLLMMPEDLREIIRGLPTWREFVCRVEFSNRDEDPFSDSLSLISSVMLNGIRGLVDDRRVRLQGITGVLLDPLLQILRHHVTSGFLLPSSYSTPDFQGYFSGHGNSEENNYQATADLDELMFLHWWKRVADYRDDALVDVDDAVVKDIESLDEPPEDCHMLARRVTLSLLVQIISRFFVGHALRPVYLTDEGSPNERKEWANIAPNVSSKKRRADSPNIQHEYHSGFNSSGHKTDISCSRSEMLTRVMTIQSKGGIALLVHLLVNGGTAATGSGTLLPLCNVDKQFIVWTMREVVVSAFELCSDRVDGILRWFMWLLGCSVNDDSAISVSPADISGNSHAASPARTNAVHGGISKNVNQKILWLPAFYPQISLSLRLMIIQEIRLLIGGENWSSFLPEESTISPSKIFHIPVFVSTNTVHAANMNFGGPSNEGLYSNFMNTLKREVSGKTSNLNPNQASATRQSVNFAPCRVPILSTDVKCRLVRVGILPLLLDIVFGKQCDAGIAKFLVSCDDRLPAHGGAINVANNNSTMAPVSELALETWWSSLTTLFLLIADCDMAKGALDEVIGVDELAKVIVPLSKIPNMPPELMLLLVEMCVEKGSVIAPTRPFRACGRMPRGRLSVAGEADRVSNHIARSNSASPLPPSHFSKPSLTPVHVLLNRPKREFTDEDDSMPIVTQFSPMYFSRGRSLHMMFDCMRPSLLKIPIDDYLCQLSIVRADDGSHGRNSLYINASTPPPSFCRSVSASTPPGPIRKSSFSLESSGAKTGGRLTRNSSLASITKEHTEHNWEETNRHSFQSTGPNQHVHPASGAGHGSMSSHMAFRMDNSIVHVPFTTSLSWGLHGCMEHVLHLVNTQIAKKTPPVPESVPIGLYQPHQPYSHLEERKFSKLDIFLPSKLLCPWLPQFSRILIRSKDAGLLLLTLAFVTSGSLQTMLLTCLSHLIDGNPGNGKLLNETGIPLSLTVLLAHMSDTPRAAFSYLLSQLLRYDTSDKCLKELVRISCFYCGCDAIEAIQHCINASDDTPTKRTLSGNWLEVLQPVIETIRSKEVKDMPSCHSIDASNQILYVIGRIVENSCPSSYFHFDQGSAVSTYALLPPVSKLPLPKSGFSVSTWVRVGSLGNTPIATLFQISTSLTPSGMTTTSAPVFQPTVINAFFRVIYRGGKDDDGCSSVVSGISTLPGDFITAEESSKRTLQLCVSYKGSANSSESIAKSPSMNSFHTNDSEESTEASTASSDGISMDSILVQSMAAFSMPDSIIEFDWSEMGEWHLLNLSWNLDNGLMCAIDGLDVPVLHWTANQGYVRWKNGKPMQASSSVVSTTPFTSTQSGATRPTLHSRPALGVIFPNQFYPTTSKESLLQVAVGGLLYESDAYTGTASKMLAWSQACKIGVGEGSSEEATIQELALFQAYTVMIGGFSGTLGELVLSEGMVDKDSQIRCLDSGESAALSSIIPKVLTALSSSCVKRHGHDTDAESYSSNNSNLQNIPVDETKAMDTSGRDRHSISVTSAGRRSRSASPPSTRVSRSLFDNPSMAIPNGIQDVDDRDFSASLARASSPSLARASTQGQKRSDRWSTTGEVLATGPPPAAAPAPVSTVFYSMFGSTTSAGSGVDDFKQLAMLYGDIQTHQTRGIATVVNALGGISMFYPLLVIDRPRQIAAVQVISKLITISAQSYKLFCDSLIGNVILYCMYSTQTSMNTLEATQVIFETVTVSQVSSTEKYAPDVERIKRLQLLRLLSDVVLCSRNRPQLARSFVLWLRSICDDVPSNLKIVLEQIGLVPLLIISSAWECLDVSTDVSASSSSSGIANSPPLIVVTESQIPKPTLLDTSKLANSMQQVGNRAANIPPTDIHRIQGAVTQFLKLLLVGTSGDVSHITVIGGSVAPNSTGFSPVHFSLIFSFVARILEASGKGDLTDVNDANSILCVLGPILTVADTPCMPSLLGMIRATVPGPSLWFIIFGLCSHSVMSLRLAGLRLLSLSFSTLGGQVDAKQIAVFEKINGFLCLADCLSQHSDENAQMVIEGLLNVLFWRRHAVGGLGIRHSASTSLSSSRRSSFDANDSNENDEYEEDDGNQPLRSDGAAVLEEIENDDGSMVMADMIDAELQMEDHVEALYPSDSLSDAGAESHICEIEMIHIPQILQVVMKVFQCYQSNDALVASIQPLEQAFVQRLGNSAYSSNSNPDENVAVLQEQRIVMMNFETICSQKDWLCWIYETILFLEIPTDVSRSVSPTSIPAQDEKINIPNYHNFLEEQEQPAYNKMIFPLYSLIQTIFHHDVSLKPSSNRFVFDIFKLPYSLQSQALTANPVTDMTHALLQIILQLLCTFQNAFSVASIDTTLYVMRNLSMVLEQLLEKFDVPWLVCIRVLQSIDLMNYQAHPTIRPRIKDTQLPEIRNACVGRCLLGKVERNELVVRSYVLNEMQSPLQNLIISSESNKPVYDVQILVLLLSWYAAVADEIFEIGDKSSSMPASLRVNDADVDSDSSVSVEGVPSTGPAGGIDSDGACDTSQLPQLLEAQTIYLNLIHICISSADECKKLMQRLCLHDAAWSKLNPSNTSSPLAGAVTTDSALWSDVALVGFSNSYRLGSDDESMASAESPSFNASAAANPVAATNSWWGSWSSTTNTAAPSADKDEQLTPSSANSNDPFNTTVASSGAGDEEDSLDIEANPQSQSKHSEEALFSAGEEASLNMANTKPHNSIEFIAWYNRMEHRDVHILLRSKIAKELKGVTRLVERYQERLVLRKTKQARLVGERVSRDRLLKSKIWKESKEKMAINNTKLGQKFALESKKCIKTLQERIKVGEVEFVKYIQSQQGLSAHGSHSSDAAATGGGVSGPKDIKESKEFTCGGQSSNATVGQATIKPIPATILQLLAQLEPHNNRNSPNHRSDRAYRCSPVPRNTSDLPPRTSHLPADDGEIDSTASNAKHTGNVIDSLLDYFAI